LEEKKGVGEEEEEEGAVDGMEGEVGC